MVGRCLAGSVAGLLALGLADAACAAAQPPLPSLCRADEQVVFSCMIRQRIASVCASKGFSATSGYFQYRFGAKGRLEIAYPAVSIPPGDAVHFSSTGYGGGGEAHLRFQNGRFEYIAYEKYVRGDGPSAGVVVRRDGRLLSHLRCDGRNQADGSIDYKASERVAQEPFVQERVPRH